MSTISTGYAPSSGSGTGPSTSAPNPYVGFGDTPTPAPTGPSVWGTPTGTAPPKPAAQPKQAATPAAPPSTAPSPTTPPPGRPPGAPPGPGWVPPRRRSSTTTIAWVAGVAAVMVLAIVGVIVAGVSALTGGGSGGGYGGTDDPLPTTWEVDYATIGQDYGTFGPVDGTLPGTVLRTSAGLVTIQEPSTPGAVLVSLDLATGDVQWERDLPEGRCTLVTSEVLTCLERTDGEFVVVGLDAASGDEVGEPVPTELDAVPYVLLPLGDGLVTLTARLDVVALGPDGSVRWEESSELDMEPSDLEYREIDARVYDGAVLLHAGPYAGTVHVLADGVVHALPCRSVAATDEAWVCEGDDETTGYGATDGVELWSEDWLDYILVSEYQRIVPVLLIDGYDGTVTAADPLTGVKGAPLPIASPSDNLSFVGTAEHPVVTTNDSAVLLSADGSTTLWETSVVDEYLNIATAEVVGDVLVLDAEHSYGFDLVTGDELWRHDWLASTVQTVDDALIGADYSEIVRYDLP